jgi:phytoene/squalene synthetase
MDSSREEFLRIFNSIDFQQIRDHPNILIAANFWDEERFCAARICYKAMRAIDDAIDNYKANHKSIEPGERKEFRTNVVEWLKMFTDATEYHPLQKELLQAIHTFRIPLWPMETFAKAMIYDINNDGFPTLEAFLNYARGASVAPASIFVHLAGLKRNEGKYEVPLFDVKEIATPCAMFSYLVHIIRDFQKDQLANLSYFADNLILKHGLTRQKLRGFAEGNPVNNDFRGMIGEYYTLADHYSLKTYTTLQQIRPLLEPRYQLSLEIIFDLYVLVFEKIDLKNGRFTTEELNPSPEETRERVLKTIMNFRSA